MKIILGLLKAQFNSNGGYFRIKKHYFDEQIIKKNKKYRVLIEEVEEDELC